ncbi:hypothetical protein X560_2288 [Listeria fleischmannii 1991]|uniref:GIY-YIG nuclease family protein n=2 Tax=Listeria fleischmannii TaxID=1069827 RepID=A0A2X3GQU7_9LIST|nr:GIY-YIG nuclease family protein [Listeria fleischmannii]EMG28372.1 hypothetical protein LFLEISCH_05809 [Listeria fleischmannii subsp. fleischmannii LU2006-1]KMT58462.1 hypothetical protein X560_2288 [Listeria fleischmannii 1991]SQC70778.1 Uncharacterised protein [Listeria fleischmannii subsp. fleischmannii]
MGQKSEDRKAKIRAYKETPPDAGVYRFSNEETGVFLIGKTMNLKGAASKLEFGMKLGEGSMLPRYMADEARKSGVDKITFEVLERVEVKPEMTRADIEEECDVLFEIWEEKLESK